MMKKYIIYLVLILVGVLAGWFLFSDAEVEVQEHSEAHVASKWTCSMHPQITQPEAGDCPICGMDLIPATSGEEGLGQYQFKLTENAIALGNIQTTEVKLNEGSSNTISLSGKIIENEEANAVQVAYFSGRIEELYVNTTGEHVKKGQLMAAVYSSELNAAQQELLAASKLKTQQPELYKVVRNKLKLWKLTDMQIDAIENSETTMTSFPIYATQSGVVTRKIVNEGDYVKEGSQLFQIADLSTVWASFDVYENQIGQLEKGQAISVKVKSHPLEKFKTVIDYVNPNFDAGKRTVAVRSVLKNESDKLKIGMFVEGVVSISSDDSKKISIPSSAVLWTGKRSVVYVKDTEKPVFELKEVIIGEQQGEIIEINRGLKNGDLVVSNGAFTVDAAAQLQGKRSMMNTNTSKKNQVQKLSGFETEVDQLVDAYLKIKNALAGDNPKVASFEAQNTLKLLSSLDRSAMQEEEKLSDLHKDLNVSISKIRDAASIEKQREHFIDVSNKMLELTEHFSFSRILYKQHCPMANHDKGANWISEEAQIRNPYFGKVMYQCGVSEPLF